jgi:hypothetical protein
MTRINRLKVGILGGALAVAALSPLVSATTAEARGGKEYFVQSYEFDRPMHGYSGRAGSYYCDYQRLPNRVCSFTANGEERCVIKGWTLRQHCY